MRHQRETPGSGVEILYGRQALLETLRAGRRIYRRLLVAEGMQMTGMPAEILRLAHHRHVPVATAAKRDLDRLTANGHHQGMALETGPYPWVELDALFDVSTPAAEPPFLLVLDHVQDPQNVGSMMRSADAAGVGGVILPRDRACAVTPAVVRASSGAVEHLQVAQVTNLVRAIAELKERRIWVYALEAFPEAPLHTDVRLDGAAAIVVGNEGQGVGRLVRQTCDGVLRLPMRGKVGSLNAAVAAAIALYEVRRQRDAAATPPA